MEGYWCYWHGGKGYSGVGLHVSKAIAPERPTFSHPEFNFENRIASVDLITAAGALTVASVYVPNGGKDFPAKIRFLEALDAYAQSFQETARRLVLCGDMNVRIDGARRSSEGTQAPSDWSASRRAGAHGASHRPRPRGPRPRRSTRTTRICSRGGRRGGTCGSATSGGGSTTSSPAPRWPRRWWPVRCRPRSARAITHR